MKGGKSPLKQKAQQKGYTIVEVMIVLAVSGVMFVVAATFINGRQARTSFTSGVNEMTSRIQATIDQSTDGRFTDIKLKCDVTGGAVDAYIASAADNSKGQGTNAPCVFMGKALKLRSGTYANDTSKYKYEVLILAGKREAVGLVDAGIKVVSGGTRVANNNSGRGLVATNRVPQGLKIQSFKVGGIELIDSVAMLGFVRDPSGGDVAAVYSDPGGPGFLPLTSPAVICLTDDTRYGTITIGEGAANLSVKTQLGLNNCP